MWCQYKPYYYENFPIARLKILDFPHMHIDGIRTGGMKKEAFLALKESIEKDGLVNPIVIEVDSGPCYRIAMGNNRVEVIRQKGGEFIKALVLFRSSQPVESDGPCTHITDLESFMGKVHPGDSSWKKSGWADRLLKFTASRKMDKPWLVAY